MTWTYPLLKTIHVGCVAVSLALFVIRGIWMMQGSAHLARRWVGIAPHLVDTLLLASAVALAVMLGTYPGSHEWLTAKVAGLVVYIVLGTVALKRGRTRGIRIGAFGGALVAYAYVISVAITKSPAGFLALGG
jgi:uncharacterized membrane protein SirB2